MRVKPFSIKPFTASPAHRAFFYPRRVPVSSNTDFSDRVPVSSPYTTDFSDRVPVSSFSKPIRRLSRSPAAKSMCTTGLSLPGLSIPDRAVDLGKSALQSGSVLLAHVP